VKRQTILTILSVLILVPPLAIGQEKEAAGSSATRAFEIMKKWAGEWEGEATGAEKGRIFYRLTGNGSALIETLAPGTPHEMISVYHMNGPDLEMTHYCAVGNQPHMRFDPDASTPDRFVFTFVSGSNMDVKKDMHIHGVVFRVVDGDHIESEWESYKDGKTADTLRLVVARKK